MKLTDAKGEVIFDHIQFGYNPEQMIIHDFSCHIKPGQMVATVGPTGAGKTTIVKLLMRFYDVNQSSIRIDGHDVRDFNRSELREQFGMVLQDTWLFQGTIMENIRYGRLDATDEEVIAAAKAAHAHKFIQTLPGGYQLCGYPYGNPYPEGNEQSDEGAYQLCHCTQAFYNPGCRYHSGDERRQRNRAGKSRNTACTAGFLLRAVQFSVCTIPILITA